MVSFGNTADDYAQHRAGFPESFFDALSRRDLVDEGLRVLDLGTGTGTIARGLARRGAAVTGLDISANMMAQAERLDQAAGVKVDYRVAKAEENGQVDNQFDLVTAGQCWHWFDARKAAAEVQRVLKPGGALVIAHFDWLPLPGNVVEATEAMILRHNPKWHLGGLNGIHGRHITDMRVAGFEDVHSFSYDEPAIYSHAAWRGRIRASAGISVSLSDQQVAAFDKEHRGMLQRQFPQDPLRVDHCVFVVIGRLAGPSNPSA